MAKPTPTGLTHRQLKAKWAATPEEQDARYQRSRAADPELFAIFDALQRFEITPEDAAEAIKALRGETE